MRFNRKDEILEQKKSQALLDAKAISIRLEMIEDGTTHGSPTAKRVRDPYTRGVYRTIL